MDELAKARLLQAEQRKLRIEIDKNLKHEEYLDGLRYGAAMAKREEEERRAQSAKMQEHRMNLRNQIESRERERARYFNIIHYFILCEY